MPSAAEKTADVSLFEQSKPINVQIYHPIHGDFE
jgi:hypothetical protein